jgi:tungstate transport system substrate-binding protein
MNARILFVCAAWLGLLGGCRSAEPPVLRLATTTSTFDSGLLDAILPDFEASHTARIEVIAVGSGQAIALGERGDVDVILVHSPAAEQAFVDQGFGLERHPVMFNDFIVVGPPADPAGIAGALSASQALGLIAQAEAPFISRGDDSGTHAREQQLWQAAGITPDPASGWYLSIGQGMGDTLRFAEERQAYTLSDRGTYLSQQETLPSLAVLVGGAFAADNPDPALLNPYSVIQVNPDLHAGIQAALAQEFVAWLTSLDTQQTIGQFGIDRFGQPLFTPDSAAWRAANPP